MHTATWTTFRVPTDHLTPGTAFSLQVETFRGQGGRLMLQYRFERPALSRAKTPRAVLVYADRVMVDTSAERAEAFTGRTGSVMVPLAGAESPLQTYLCEQSALPAAGTRLAAPPPALSDIVTLPKAPAPPAKPKPQPKLQPKLQPKPAK